MNRLQVGFLGLDDNATVRRKRVKIRGGETKRSGTKREQRCDHQVSHNLSF